MAEFGDNSDALKCIVIGSSGVGKTALTKRLVENTFSEHIQSTIGIEYEFTTIEVDGQQVKLNVWDTAGQEKFRSITRAYYREAVCVLIVFDLTDKETFNEVNTWVDDVRHKCDPKASIILVGNKSDLSENRQVSNSEATEYAKSMNLKYIETSAKTGDNVRTAFIQSAEDVCRKPVSANSSTKHLQANDKQKTSGSCC